MGRRCEMGTANVKWVRLGDYIEQCDERNTNEIYSIKDVRGISIEKRIIDTKANMDGVSVAGYKLYRPNCFCYVPVTSRNGGKITLAINTNATTYIVSSAYEVFKIKDEKTLSPLFLFLFLSRPEFDRYARYNSWGSAREVFSWEDMCNTLIPLPTVIEQQKVVNAWKAFREIKEQNEAKVAPLMQVCQSYIQELKHKYPLQEIGPYIEEFNERNVDLSVQLSQGIANTKVFQDPKQVALNSKSDKIVRTGQFGYNRATTRNGEKISIAYRIGEDCTVSSAYCVFKITHNEILDPYFLWMWVSRSEFDRYARYMSKGSAHEFFEFDEMCRVKIPLPPIDIQRAIVNIYKCANEARRIAEEADRLSRKACPALLQHVIHS